MRQFFGIFLAFSLLLLLGCAGNWGAAPSPQAGPQLIPQPQGEPAVPARPGNASGNLSPSANATVPGQNATVLEPAPPEPISIIKTIGVGQSINFTEGKLTLDDIYTLHQDEPALITLRHQDGSVNRSSQMFPFSEYSFISKSGTRYWIATGDTQAGYDIYVRRAAFYIFTARDNDTRFDKSLYADITGKRLPLPINSSLLMGKEGARGLLNKSANLSFGSLTVKLDDLDRYPDGKYPALLSIYDGGGLIGWVELQVGQAYAAGLASGEMAVIYNEAASLGKNGGRLASIALYQPANAAEANRTYSVAFPAISKPASGYRLGTFQLNDSSSLVSTERDFYITLSPAQPADIGKDGAVLDIYDQDEVLVSSGFAKKDRPLSFTDIYGRTYNFWLESTSSGSATVSMYRAG